MAKYPDLPACGIRYMQVSLHVAGGLEPIDAFWEARGLDRSRERLLFTAYTRNGHPHTVYLHWERSHEECCDVYLGIDARRPSKVWPDRRPAERYRLRDKDFREFAAELREMKIYHIRARYAYPSERELFVPLKTKDVRIKSVTYEILDEKQTPTLNLTHQRSGDKWLSIVEPLASFPFPEDDEFFADPYQLGCYLAEQFRMEPQP